MSLLNNLKRYLYGSPGMDYGQVGTQGLLGESGSMGGGLLQDNFSKMNNAEGGLLSNIPEGALLGAALYGQGLKGKDPLAGAFPAVTQAAQLKKLTTPAKTELQKNLEAAGYKSGTPEYKAALNAYLTKNKKFTLSDEVLNVYNKVKGKTGEDFDNAFDELSEPEQKLYRNKIEGNTDLFEQMISDRLENFNEPIELTSQPDANTLQTGQKYKVDGQIYRWDGKKMIPSN